VQVGTLVIGMAIILGIVWLCRNGNHIGHRVALEPMG